jgi:methyltransferase (TIGR00027 family)
MRRDRASLTAELVALARGVGFEDNRDPTAARFLSSPLRALVGAAPLRSVTRVVGRSLVEHIALRTSAIDRVIRDADLGQLVILGAGLDGRAWRMQELSQTRVFEVDHPSTQALKKSRMGATAAHQHLVAVDFAKDDLGRALRDAGHDVTRPTTWVWEGVTMYLERPAFLETLHAISTASAARSILAVTYSIQRKIPLGAVGRNFTHALFRAFGEPLHGLMTPAEMTSALTGAGFTLEEDTDEADWAQRENRPVQPTLFHGERLAVARK